jgi:hypothetical protein
MRRTRIRVVRRAIPLLATILIASCGDPSLPPAPTPDVAPAPRADPSPRPARSAPEPAITAADADALVAAWVAAEPGSDKAEAAADRLVAAGAPAVERLLALLEQDEARAGYSATEVERLIQRFGPAAVAPLVAALGSPNEYVRLTSTTLLARMSGSWAFSDEGPAVCRALLARFDVEEDRDAAAGTL